MLKFIFIFFLLVAMSNVFGADGIKLNFSQQYTVLDGLSHNGVTTTIEDSRGYIWIGTYDGLNRFDGYQFLHFKNTVDKDILFNNRIRSLFEDSKGNVWIGTEDGVSIYDGQEQKIKNIYSNKQTNPESNGPIISKTIEDVKSKRFICATEDNGLLFFDDKFKLIEKINPKLTCEKKTDRINYFDIVLLNSKEYLLATSIGLVHYNIQTHEHQFISKKIARFTGFIQQLPENRIISNLDNGIVIIKMEFKHGKYFFSTEKELFKEYQFISSSLDEQNNLWLGTIGKGAIKVTDVNRLFHDGNYNTSTFYDGSEEMYVNSIYSSRKTGTWLSATYDKGIFRFENKKNPFKHYNTSMGEEHDFLSNNVMSLAKLDSNRVFICTLNKGIALFNIKSQLFEPLPFDISPMNKEKIKAIYVDSNQDIWMQIGFQGLFVLHKNTGQLRKILSNGKHPWLDFIIRSFAEDEKGNVWLGGRNGVHKVTRYRSGVVKSIHSLNDNPFFEGKPLSKVRQIYLDPLHDFIWVATGSDGLFRLSAKNNTPLSKLNIEQYVHDKEDKKSISSNFVTSVLRLPNKDLWISTERGGICKVLSSDEEPKFIAYAEKNGLSNHVVTSLQFDKDQNLWVSTNIGINKFDVKTEKFRRFSREDGLPFEAFKYGSISLGDELLFFGYDGICYFNPNDVHDNLHLPNLVFGNFRLFNKNVLPGDTINKRVILQKRLSNGGEISLKHSENVFSVELKSLHYSNVKNHLLRYQLLPVNSNWIEVPSDQRFINFNELRPGKYILRAMASNSYNKWTDVKELKIIIMPPWWKKTWAVILYALILGAIVYVIIAFRLKVHSLKHSLEIDQLEIDKVKEVNAAKLRYFSNISHEIKTPLTLISGPVENLMGRFQNHNEISEKLNIIQRQSKKITQLVDQVHDFQRSDANLLRMNLSLFRLDEFINNLTIDFEFLAKSSNKRFEVKGDSNEIFVSADKDKLEKILNNLLSNAFKYSSSEDSICLNYSINGKDVSFNVEDTGRGIDAEDLPHIFERFYLSINKQSKYIGGSGIGLAFTKRLVEMHYGFISVESKINEGTTVCVKLPIAVKDKSEQQKIKEQEVLAAGKIQISEIHQEDIGIDLKLDSSFSDLRIFLVEDNTDMRLFVEGTLNKYFKVKSFTNGKECLEVLEKEWPDIIVSDVLMPQLNGFELCRAVKNDIKTSHIPVVLLTACTTIDDEIKGLREGADAYIKKPFNMQHLVTSIETLMNNRKQLRERFQMTFPLTLENKEEDESVNQVFLERLYHVMTENLDNSQLDVNYLAKAMLLNRTHLYEKVKVATNQTPFEFIKNFRITKAAQLLAQDRVTVNEAVVMTGFKSRTSFTNLFKEKYGVTPGKYAEEAKKKVD